MVDTTILKSALDKFAGPGVVLLEKQQSGRVSLQDISHALDEYARLFKAKIASKGEILTLSRAFPNDIHYAKAAAKAMENGEPTILGGPASIELVDREGHLITTNALEKAFQRYMDNFRTRNAMVLHSDVQVGWALPAYISKGGQIFKSGVDEKGLYFITECRDDTKISKRVIEQINEGKLKSYSIAGSATKVQNLQKGMVPYLQVDELELAEVTVCEKGVNQGAGFEIIKSPNPATKSCIDGSCLLQKQGEVCEHCIADNADQTGKLDQSHVTYRMATDVEKDAGIMCGTCRFFNEGMGTCDLVTGMIYAGDWCKLFDPLDKSPVLENENNVREMVTLMEKQNGDIDFLSSFMNWITKDEKKPHYCSEHGQWEGEDHKAIELMITMKATEKAPTEPFHTLNNVGGREAEHHQLLRELGFPSEQPLESMRYVPVVEVETNDKGVPIHNRPPWVVNEAGQELGERLDHVKDPATTAGGDKTTKKTWPERTIVKAFLEWMHDEK